MGDKLRKILYELGELLELVMAGAVVCGIIAAVFALVPELASYWQHRTDPGAFRKYLDAVFNVVIGIEFVKMLCKPSSENIIEVLVFLIARHMIVTTTTPLEDLIAVSSICILFLFRRFMLMTKPDKDRHIPNIFGAMKMAQSREFQKAVIRAEEELEAQKAEEMHEVSASEEIYEKMN